MATAKKTGRKLGASFEWATDKVTNANTIWRYMDLPKFLSLLTTECIYFPPASCYLSDDAFEGALPPNQATLNEQQDMFATQQQRREWDAKIHQEEARRFMDDYGVSCWHQNYEESVAMWKLYTVPGASGQGVAIESSIDAFKKSVLSQGHFLIGAVKYVDYSQLDGVEEDVRRLFYKRSVYSHEREFRIVVKLEEHGVGTTVKVDLATLIHCVRVPPKSSSFLVESIQKVLERFSLNGTVLRSEIDSAAQH